MANLPNLITIPGMTEDALLNLSTAPTGGGLRPFPCDSKGWTRHHGVIVKADIKVFGTSQGEKSNISLVIANGEFGGEVLIDLDTRNVAPGVPDVEKAQQDNLQDLMKVIKILGAHTNGKLDVAKLKASHGQLVEVIAKHKGFRGGTSKAKFDANGLNRSQGGPRWDGKETLFHDVQLIFKGQVDEAEFRDTVDESKGLPELPKAPGSRPSPTAPSGDPMDEGW